MKGICFPPARGKNQLNPINSPTRGPLPLSRALVPYTTHSLFSRCAGYIAPGLVVYRAGPAGLSPISPPYAASLKPCMALGPIRNGTITNRW